MYSLGLAIIVVLEKLLRFLRPAGLGNAVGKLTSQKDLVYKESDLRCQVDVETKEATTTERLRGRNRVREENATEDPPRDIKVGCTNSPRLPTTTETLLLGGR